MACALSHDCGADSSSMEGAMAGGGGDEEDAGQASGTLRGSHAGLGPHCLNAFCQSPWSPGLGLSVGKPGTGGWHLPHPGMNMNVRRTGRKELTGRYGLGLVAFP